MNVSNKEWLDSDGVRLRELRISAGIEAVTLATHFCITTKMLDQLESGGSDAFYSSDIKFQTGRRILRSFDTDVSNASPDSTKKSPAMAFSKNEVNTDGIEKIVRYAERDLNHSWTDAFAFNFQRVDWRKAGLVLLLLIAVAMLYDALQDKSVGEISRPYNDLAKASLTKIASGAENLNDSSFVAKVEEQAMTTKLPSQPLPLNMNPIENKTITTPNINSIALNNNECLWSSSAPTLNSPVPIKSGDYVHIVANSDAAICVMDGGKITKVFSLRQGNEKSIYGKPPFRVYSKEMANLKLYYQGHRLVVQDSSTSDVVLAEVPIRVD